MCLWQTFARRIYLFPDECNSVHTEELDSKICEEEKFACHCNENRGVRVVQIPLVVIEGRPDPAAIGKLDERARVVITDNVS